MNNKGFLKIVFLYFYIYFIGPLLWCVWMVFRLRIISLQECYHCICSPLAISIFISYFLFNLIYLIRLRNKLSILPVEVNDEITQTYFLSALKMHFISIVSFGTIGTSLCLSMLSTNGFSFVKIASGAWLQKAMIGSLSGASLVFLFYIMFSTIIITTVTDPIKTVPSHAKNQTLILLKHYNQILYIIGLVLFFGTVVASLVYHKNSLILYGDSLPSLVSFVLPVFMSGLLFYKSNKKIKLSINVEGKILLNNESNSNIIFKIKATIQLFLLVFFCILLFTNKMQVWLFLLIVGFCLSLIFGRVYCGWCCPVNAVNKIIELLFKLMGIKKRRPPHFLQSSLSGIICFTLFLCFFTFSLISGKRFQLFSIITYLGIFISALFNSSFWCNYLCPWGTILKITSRFSLFQWRIDKDKCIKCGICRLNCSTASISISDSIQRINFTKCLQCMQCTCTCHKNAITIRK